LDVNIEKQSWLQLTDLLDFEGVIFWDQTEYPDIPISEDDQYIQLSQQQSKRIDLLAWDFYGDVNVFWVIMLANNIDLPNQIYEGMVLRLPAQATIDDLLKPSK
jgi:hypothetical protein